MRTKLGLLGLCAFIVGMMSMSASAAQGATLSWLILPSGGGTATELKAFLVGEKDTDLSLLGEIAGLKIIITCGSFALKGVYIEPVGKLTEGGKVVFKECEVYKTFPLGELDERCTVRSAKELVAGTVESGEGKGVLVLHEFKDVSGEVLKEVLTKIEPKAGPTGTFATIRLEGAECPYTEVNQVHGTLFIKDCEHLENAEKKLLPCDKNATVHKVKHLIEANAELTALYIGGHSANQLANTKVHGSAWIKLGNDNAGINHTGLEWSAMDA
jgi:hypothetical protein